MSQSILMWVPFFDLLVTVVRESRNYLLHSVHGDKVEFRLQDIIDKISGSGLPRQVSLPVILYCPQLNHKIKILISFHTAWFHQLINNANIPDIQNKVRDDLLIEDALNNRHLPQLSCLIQVICCLMIHAF